jgi:membrane protease YdiL (CAAX protease family)
VAYVVAPPASPPTVPLSRYALGVVITVLAISSQYFLPQLWSPARVVYGNLPGDLFVVYGIPVIAFALLVGLGPLRNWKDRMELATIEGLRWYGLLSLLGVVIIVVLALVYQIVDPAALKYLSRPNPALTQAAGDPWFWIGFSFVVGAFEETIFRGWIFGYWRYRTTRWIIPAVWTSALFAGLHLYYGFTYAAAAPLIFPGLFLTGFAFAATYHASGGNLVVVALLHGAHDAAAFYTLINPVVGELLYYLLILIGAAIGLVYYLRDSEARLRPI